MIDIVQDYTYLGTRISSSGNFTLSLEHLRQKALHAFFSLRRHTDFSTLKPSLACKIFDTMIQPILTHNTSGPSTYLDLTRKNASRKALVKLRISSHKLLIETGRYDNIPRNERVCNVCNRKTIEDEIHFLLDCPSYSSLRDMFFSKIEPSLPLTRLLVKETLLSHIMNSTDYFINTQTINFICFLVLRIER